MEKFLHLQKHVQSLQTNFSILIKTRFMKQIFFAFLIIIGNVHTSFSQSLDNDLDFLLKNFPNIRTEMTKVKAERDGSMATYIFTGRGGMKGTTYNRTYVYGRSKLCFHHFTIEKNGKKYILSTSDKYTNLTFHTETYSDSKNEWIKSKEIKRNRDNLPTNIKFALEVTQGTLSMYR